MAITWVQRLKRVFHIDIETCQACGGAVRIIACIEAPVVIEQILTHLGNQSATAQAPPVTALSSTTSGAVPLSPQTPQPGWLPGTGRRQSAVCSQARLSLRNATASR